jgi:NTE family protein
MNITNLVFEGGGVKGIAFCGAVHVLEQTGILKNITHIIGSSAGAICAGLLAIKYTSSELETIMKGLNMNQLTDDTWGFFRDIYRLFHYYGVYRGDAFISWYSKLIENKTGDKNFTFIQVYEKYNIDLTITGTCLNKQTTVYFNYINTPTMPIVNAVRISMSIPGVFCAVKMGDCVYVDGGVLNNYPINYYNNIENTLGFKLVDNTDNSNPENNIMYNDFNVVHGLKDFISLTINSMMREIERSHVHNSYWGHTVCIDCFGVACTDFDLSDDKKQKLIQNGQIETQKWIDKNMSTDAH